MVNDYIKIGSLINHHVNLINYEFDWTLLTTNSGAPIISRFEQLSIKVNHI